MHYLGEVENIVANIFRKYIQDNKHKILSESAWFCRRCDKNTLCVFGFAVPIAVHLQNTTLTFTR